MDAIQEFHSHLDECGTCRQNPFNLCWIGERLLLRATVMPLMSGGLTPRVPDAPKRGAKVVKSKSKKVAKSARR